MQNAPTEHSAILSTFIKLRFVFKTIVLSVFEWSLKTGFIVFSKIHSPVINGDQNTFKNYFAFLWYAAPINAQQFLREGSGSAVEYLT